VIFSLLTNLANKGTENDVPNKAKAFIAMTPLSEARARRVTALA
jgi:hypothetical protein